ncbi:hypothetical protein POL68_31270 [Stigmatella sp. ncwal1]|uniref:Uncharacterized protein n=1 Tax=Stigmatella ashevillensis TaxID=2995309 RepID=A0ABT5DHB9_9BACT|nr:hypothetical protein [Stigmatella ashevillena]MDC0712984.1 hypothetical protein [Stigmatella ashevillena]
MLQHLPVTVYIRAVMLAGLVGLFSLPGKAWAQDGSTPIWIPGGPFMTFKFPSYYGEQIYAGASGDPDGMQNFHFMPETRDITLIKGLYNGCLNLTSDNTFVTGNCLPTDPKAQFTVTPNYLWWNAPPEMRRYRYTITSKAAPVGTCVGFNSSGLLSNVPCNASQGQHVEPWVIGSGMAPHPFFSF